MRRMGVLAAMLVAVTGFGCGEAAAQLPSGTTAFSPGAALDMQSWQTFIQATTPAVGGGGVAFECWATDAETFPTVPTSTPPTWPTDCGRVAPRRFQTSRLLAAHSPAGARGAADANDLPVACSPPGDAAAGNFPSPNPPTKSYCISEEVRRNQLSFNYIASNGLYWQKGLAVAFANPAPVSFTEWSVELKADWVPVATLSTWLQANGVPQATQPWVMANYYITTSTQSPYNPFALAALHVSLKTPDHPDWVWATFEHQNNPGRCDTMGCYDQFGAASNPSIAPNAQANLQYPACGKSQALQAMFTQAVVPTVMNNYCLKETQVAPTQGPLAILDGNSVTERINAAVPIARASCLTCHAYAAVNSTGAFYTPNPGLAPTNQPIGPFTLPSNAKQIDFVWGIINAN
jgi:hypothetical protein